MIPRKCAVVTPVGPGHEYLIEDCIESVHEAFASNRGPFTSFSIVRVDDMKGSLGRSVARNLGVAQAKNQDAEWIFFLDADDLMHRGAFGVMTDYYADHDAVWGLVCELNEDEEGYRVREGQPASIERIEHLLVNDPTLTLQMGHFVRTEAAIETPFNAELNCGEDFDYYLRLWARFRCRKVAKPLFINRRGFHSTGPRSATGRQWREAVQRVIRTHCEGRYLACEFVYDGEPFQFRVTNPFDLIQRHYLEGEFFELAELRFLRDRLPKGLAIVDVGANIGNHTVFLSRFLAPRRILVLEPNPELLETLNSNLQVNHVTQADTTFLGLAIGADCKCYSLMIKDSNNIGAAHLVESPSGTVRSERLDDILKEAVDLIKIDVEGMELEVLAGAERTIARFRPYLLVESFNANVQALDRWCRDHEYRVAQRFQYVNAVNLFLEPVQQAASG